MQNSLVAAAESRVANRRNPLFAHRRNGMAEQSPFVEVRELTKAFPGVVALSQVNVTIHPGEILALVGENGAGKSTFIKILSGVYRKDAGQILVNGREEEPLTPADAFALGISVIHQEFNLVPEMTAAENVFLGRQPRSTRLAGKLGAIDRAQMETRTQEIIDLLGGDFPITTPVKHLGVAQQQFVEIAKALSLDSRLVIMDEPTSTLSSTDAERLMDVMRRLKEQGIAVVFVTHRLEEIIQVADRVVVLRDGKNAGEGMVKDLTIPMIIRMMVGRSLDTLYPKDAAEPGEVMLRVRNLTRGNILRDVSFEVRAGEIVGFAGLVGAKRTELMRALFGADGDVEGQIELDGKPVHFRSPREAVRAGMGLVPEDRKLQGLVLNQAIRENISLSSLPRLRRVLAVDRRRERAMVDDYFKSLQIRARGPEQVVKFLSGGNQQKVVLAKWLALRPKVLILDEPTRGVDVGAKAEIHGLINRFAHEGMAILMVSSELPEVLGMCDRILVMNRGRITGEFARGDASQERIMERAVIAQETKQNGHASERERAA
jgi:ABC-type sugar transport system ATPase subunit